MTDGIISPCGGFRLVNGEWEPLTKDDEEVIAKEVQTTQEVIDNIVQGDVNISMDSSAALKASPSSVNQNLEGNVAGRDINVNNTIINNINEVDLSVLDRKLDLLLNAAGIKPFENPNVVLSSEQSNEIKQQLEKVDDSTIDDPRILLMLGNASKLVFQTDEAENFFKLAKENFSLSSNIAGEIMALISLGGLYKQKGDLRQAIEFFGRAAKYSENENFDDLAARSYCDTGHVYFTFGKISTAKQYLNKSLNLISNQTDENIRLEVYLRLGELYASSKNPDKNYRKAERYLDKSLKISKKVGNTASMNRIRLHLGDFAFNQGNLNKSITHYNEVLQGYLDDDDNKLCLDAKVGIGRILMEQNKFDSAKLMFEDSLLSAEANNYSVKIGEIRYRLGKCESELGDQQTALDHFKHALVSAETFGNHSIELQANLEIGLILRERGSGMNEYLKRARQLQKDMNL